MYEIGDLKTGVIFEYESTPYLVLDSVHSKQARGGAILRTKIKNLNTGSTLNKTFKSSDKFKPLYIERQKVQYLYNDEGNYYFMDKNTFEQHSIRENIIGNAANFLIEGNTCQLQYIEGKPINIEIPIKMDFKVVKTEKGVKGDRVSSATKPAVIETGYETQVPLFIKKGDLIVIDTRTGEYVEKSKK